MGLHCDPCEILLKGPEERLAVGGLCPRCKKKMDVTRPINQADRDEIVRLIRGGKVKLEGEESQN